MIMESKAGLGRRGWTVSILLLMATMLNYMDRQTLANLAPRIIDEFGLTKEQYGNVESLFSYAFAGGSLFFGFVADRLPVRWLYPVVLILWSGVGMLTGLVHDYPQLLVCRVALGFCEAGHWPCALITTQALISSGGRTFSNSLLQSGASLGAVLTPVIIRWLVAGNTAVGAWREPFIIIGGLGLVWAVAWWFLISSRDFPARGALLLARQRGPHWVSLFADRRFWAVAVMVVCINIPWQLVRAWLPLFLQKGRGYTESFALGFNASYYLATDAGCLLAGGAALWLVRIGWTPHRSRLLVYGICAVLTALTVVASQLPQGWQLLAVLLVVGAASLGLFPCYYSFTQALSENHVGKATGLLATIGWVASAPTQKLYGRLVDQSGSYDSGFAVVGLAPIIALVAMLVLWPGKSPAEERVDPPPGN